MNCPVYYLRHDVSLTGFCLRPQAKPTQLEAIWPSVLLVDFQRTTMWYTSESSTVYSHQCENPKSYILAYRHLKNIEKTSCNVTDFKC
jgi:hypothetical protein